MGCRTVGSVYGDVGHSLRMRVSFEGALGRHGLLAAVWSRRIAESFHSRKVAASGPAMDRQLPNFLSCRDGRAFWFGEGSLCGFVLARSMAKKRVRSLDMVSNVVERSSLGLAVLCFVSATGLLAWRVWVGVKLKSRWLLLWILAAPFLVQLGSVLVLGVNDVAGVLYGATSAYAACLLVTRGRPERMLEVWKVTSEASPSSGERRSVTLHLLAFCVLMVGGAFAYFWVVGDLG